MCTSKSQGDVYHLALDLIYLAQKYTWQHQGGARIVWNRVNVGVVKQTYKFMPIDIYLL